MNKKNKVETEYGKFLDQLRDDADRKSLIPLPDNIPIIPISDEYHKRYKVVPIPKDALRVCHDCGGSEPCQCQA